MLKQFSVHDGLGISWLKMMGFRLGIITGRQSTIVTRRAIDLGFDFVEQGQLDKRTGLMHFADQYSLPLDTIGYMGDDWPDFGALAACGFAATVASAPDTIKAACHWVATRPAGQGAVREMCDWLLRERGEWDLLQSRYTNAHAASGQSVGTSESANPAALNIPLAKQ